MQIDQWRPLLHRPSQAGIIGMARICPAITVSEEAIRPHLIIIRPWRISNYRDRRDAQGDSRKNGGLEYALGTDQRNSFFPESEPSLQQRSGQDFTMNLYLLSQEFKGRKPDVAVQIFSADVTHVDCAGCASSGLLRLGRPGIGRVIRPSRPSRAKRWRHSLTVFLLMPSCRAIL